ncbi:MAG: type IV pilin N-terminal domain-containing protein [Thermoplasmata archaeon]|nr:type IV pilin N-terminal domain-containing protein [Thermoplasmata archaeon]
MAEDRIKRKVVWNKSGVSEIIGTILMLSITVVLFSSIITFVGTMPAPRQTFVVELKCSLEPVNPSNWTHECISKSCIREAR